MIKAADSDVANAGDAVEQLCQDYWYPLYAFARKKGHAPAAAEDLTQSFFADMLEKKLFRNASEERGRFRTYLLTCFSNFMNNEWRAKQTLKRGGGKMVLSLDFDKAESDFAQAPFHELTPEKSFERSWAMAVLASSLANLRRQYSDSGKAEIFNALEGYISGTIGKSYVELAEELGMREGAIKVAVHRMRERYGQQLRLQIAATVEDPSEVDDELQRLFQSLS